MNPLLSYIRYVVSFHLTKLGLDQALPEEGLEGAVAFLADGVAVLLSWVAIKYGWPFILKLKPAKVAPLIAFAAIILFIPSCANSPVEGLTIKGEWRGFRVSETVDGKLNPTISYGK